MKFTAPVNELYPAIKQTSAICKMKSPIPILSCCLLKVESEKLTVRATNLQVDVSITISVDAKEDGLCCVDGSRLEEIVREFKGNEVLSLNCDEVGFAKIKAAKSNFKLSTREPMDYPDEDSFGKGDGVEITLDAGVIRGLIARSIYACEADKGNSAITGVLFQAEDNYLTLVATDGHRLAVLKHEINCLKNLSTILPAESLKYLTGMLREGEVISCLLHENGSSFSGNGWKVSMRALEGPFPEYDYVIPENPTKAVVVARESILGALRRVSLMSEERFKPVQLSVSESGMSLSANSLNGGGAEESIDCELNGEEITLGFNAKYLMETLSVMDSKDVQMAITEHLSPVIIKEAGDRGRDELTVIMPMRLDR